MIKKLKINDRVNKLMKFSFSDFRKKGATISAKKGRSQREFMKEHKVSGKQCINDDKSMQRNSHCCTIFPMLLKSKSYPEKTRDSYVKGKKGKLNMN